MQLSLRLSAIAQMVTEGGTLVDVGCDHGYLPVYLVLHRRIRGAVAMDLRKGPLMRAQEHIAQYGLAQYIETRLSDGLSALVPGEGDTLVIAGMGGPLMERILKDGRELLPGFRELILQPQSDIAHFRRFLWGEGWRIAQEDIVREDGKFYPMMKAVRAEGEASVPHLPEEAWFGPLLLEQRHPVLRQYLDRERRLREEILSQLSGRSGDRAEERRREIEEEMRQIGAALRRYEDKGTDRLA